MRFHNINGELVQYSPQEEIDRDADEASEIAKKPMADWEYKIASSPMNRNREDHIKDVLLGIADSPAEQAIYDAKVALRAGRPV